MRCERSGFCLFQSLDILVDAVKLVRYIDILGTMWRALVTTDAMIGLPKLGHTPVITYKECFTGRGIVLVLSVARDIAVIDTLVVVSKNGGNIKTVGARHTILTLVAGHGRVVEHQVGSVVEE